MIPFDDGGAEVSYSFGRSARQASHSAARCTQQKKKHHHHITVDEFIYLFICSCTRVCVCVCARMPVCAVCLQAIFSVAAQAAARPPSGRVSWRPLLPPSGTALPPRHFTSDRKQLFERHLGLPVDMILSPSVSLRESINLSLAFLRWHSLVAPLSLLAFSAGAQTWPPPYWKGRLITEGEFCSKCPWWCEGRSLSRPGKNLFALNSFRYFFITWWWECVWGWQLKSAFIHTHSSYQGYTFYIL